MAEPDNEAASSRRQLLMAYKAGQTIFREGDAGVEMYVIEDGEVEIVRRRGGHEKRLVVLEAGDFFGEMSVLEDMPRSATARAASDCRVLPVDASTFDQILRDHPELAVRIMRTLSRRLRQFDEAESRAQAIAAGPLQGASVTGMGPALPDASAVRPAPAPAPAAVAPAVASVARLRHTESGRSWDVPADREQVLGRKDPVTGLTPEIDLSELDTRRSLSRRHARLVGRGGSFFLREEIGTANGTFVNGERLATGKEREVLAGDTVRVGLLEFSFDVVRAGS